MLCAGLMNNLKYHSTFWAEPCSPKLYERITWMMKYLHQQLRVILLSSAVEGLALRDLTLNFTKHCDWRAQSNRLSYGNDAITMSLTCIFNIPLTSLFLHTATTDVMRTEEKTTVLTRPLHTLCHLQLFHNFLHTTYKGRKSSRDMQGPQEY